MNRVDTFISLAIPLLLISTTLPAQWVWQNPYPTGNSFKAIVFIDSLTGVIAGANGSLFRTTDGGGSWEQKILTPICDFDDMTAVDREHLWMLSMDGGSYDPGRRARVFFTSDGGATWGERFNAADLPIGVTFPFRAIGFFNSLAGLSIGDSGSIRVTADGGFTWEYDQQISNRTLRKIHLLDDSLGFISAGDLQVLPDDVFFQSRSKGEIFRTTNGGSTWDEIYSDTISIDRVRFLNDLEGWAAGEVYWEDSSHDRHARHYLLRTTDGGGQWTVLFRPYPVTDIFVKDGLTGYHLSGDLIYNTTDGGDTWNTMFFGGTSGSLNRILFSDPAHGFAVGDDGRLLQYSWTASWTHYDRRVAYGGNEAVHFLDPDTGLIATWYTIERTTNAGIHWSSTAMPNIQSLDCPTMRECWAAGASGTIYHSSDAGLTWVEQLSGVGATLYVIRFADSLTGWAAGSNSTVVQTTDGGQNWVTLTPPVFLSYLKTITVQDPQRLWIRSLTQESGYSSDGGSTWVTVGSGLTGLFFLSPEIGWGRDYDSLYRTTNGGLDWEPIGWGGIAYPHFVDIDNGWAIVGETVSRTTDGGRSWFTDLRTNYDYRVRSLHMIDSGHGWAVGSEGAVVRFGYAGRLTSVDDPISLDLPSRLALDQNYPNPFNPSTGIRFTLAQGAWTSLKIVDILGRELATLVNGWLEPGKHSITWDASNYPSGVYFYRLLSQDYRDTKKMLLLR